MIVEFTGATGAGKSTILPLVARKLREQGCEVAVLPDADSARKHPTLTNLFWDFRTFPIWLAACKKNRSFLMFAWEVLKKKSDSRITALNLYGSVLRKICVLEWARASFPANELVLLDEGPLHSAHQLFAHQFSDFGSEDVETFLRKVLRPDVVVQITAPLEALLARVQTRKDPPRRRGLKPDNTAHIRKAHDLFQTLFEKEISGLPTIVVENGGDRPLEELAEVVVSHILVLSHAASR